MKQTVWQMIKFSIVSSIVTIIQIILVNGFIIIFRDIQTPLPDLLSRIFSEQIVGAGNSHWGYVLPFFLSNILANLYGWFQNRRTTFHSDASHQNILIYFVVLIILILFTTWGQGVVVYQLVSLQVDGLTQFAPTIATIMAGLVQFAVLFPLEKYVLMKEKK